MHRCRHIPLEEWITGWPLPAKAVVLRDLKERLCNIKPRDGRVERGRRMNVCRGLPRPTNAGNRAISSVGLERLPSTDLSTETDICVLWEKTCVSCFAKHAVYVRSVVYAHKQEAVGSTPTSPTRDTEKSSLSCHYACGDGVRLAAV